MQEQASEVAQNAHIAEQVDRLAERLKARPDVLHAVMAVARGYGIELAPENSAPKRG